MVRPPGRDIGIAQPVHVRKVLLQGRELLVHLQFVAKSGAIPGISGRKEN
jgi:hypothetical protein